MHIQRRGKYRVIPKKNYEQRDIATLRSTDKSPCEYLVHDVGIDTNKDPLVYIDRLIGQQWLVWNFMVKITDENETLIPEFIIILKTGG